MHKKKLAYLLLMVVALFGALWIGHHYLQAYAKETAVPSPSALQNTTVDLTSSDASGLHFTLLTPDFQIVSNGIVVINGLEAETQESGAPALPYYAAYIALPPEAEVASVTVQALEVVESNIGEVLPAPYAAVSMVEGVGANAPPQMVYEPDAAVYGANAYYPKTLYSISEPMYYRDMRLVQVTLFPLRYNPVTGVMEQAHQLSVSISFTGGRFSDLRPAPGHNSGHEAMAPLVLNYEQAQEWRNLPASVLGAAGTALPIGQETYKITVAEDGIYEITGGDLQAAGMNIASVDPDSIEMMYRGQPVAYEFIGDVDNTLESGEIIRFFGWSFDGPRIEKQHIPLTTTGTISQPINVLWLWANGTQSPISTVANNTTDPIKDSAWYSVTKEPENDYFSSWSNEWDTFPNEPDAWYWDRIPQSGTVGGGTATRSYTIEVQNIDTGGADPTYLVEVMARANASPPTNIAYTVTTSINDYGSSVTDIWNGRQSRNISDTFDVNNLIEGTNTLTLSVSTLDILYLNRITIEYMRQLQAVSDQLIFTDEVGNSSLEVAGFGSDNAIVWDITDPKQPVAINMSTGASGGTYTFGHDHPASTRFIATTEENTKAVVDITPYTPPNLNPAGGADWVAITHADFMAQATQLAAHRADPDYGGLDTHIVDIADIINQYGYGLPLPAAIHDYLAYALGNWSVAPSFVLLFGDATLNPRHLACAYSCPTSIYNPGEDWNDYLNVKTYVVSDLIFVDPFQGLVPSDHPFVLLSGNDDLADMAIGRIAAETAVEAANAVRKIITYEQNQYDAAAFNQNILFVADEFDEDNGYDFCTQNTFADFHIPNDFATDHLCLPDDPSAAEVIALRTALFSEYVNDEGSFIVNYRGHGSVDNWSAKDIITNDSTGNWLNIDRPTVILSADCLDGHFAWPGAPALSETFLLFDNNQNSVGTAAHWSSTGLGFPSEHTTLHIGFYDGFFVAGTDTIGEAINYAKAYYAQFDFFDISELYTFTLQGDPAMQMRWTDLTRTYIPAAIK